MFTDLKGYRTYIIGFLLVVLAGLKATNKIDQAAYDAIFPLLAGGGFAALRAAR